MTVEVNAVVVSTKTCRALVYTTIIRAHVSICRIYIRRAESGGWVCRFRLTWVQSSSVRCGRMYLSDSDSRYTCQKLALLLLLRRQCRIAGIRFD